MYLRLSVSALGNFLPIRNQEANEAVWAAKGMLKRRHDTQEKSGGVTGPNQLGAEGAEKRQVGDRELESLTSTMSTWRSNQLS